MFHAQVFIAGKRNTIQQADLDCIEKNPVAHSHPRQTSPDIVEKNLELRRDHQIGALRITYYLDRYHGIKISESTVSRVLKAHGENRLPKSAPKRALHTKRYAKKVPGHHVQVDVKFLKFKNEAGKVVKRYQYTAIDDATRMRALQIYPKHNQACAIKFRDDVVQSFPSESARSERIGATSFQLVFTGMSQKTWAGSMCTSNRARPS